MDMVKSPHSSVQPEELELTLRTVASNILVQRKRWVYLAMNTFLPMVKTVACWIMGKVSTRGKSKLLL